MDNKKFRKLKIDNELKDLLPPQTEEEHKILEESIKKDGCTNPLITWNDYIVDGHNRYEICEKYKIGFEEIKLGYNTKDEIIMWMLENQLGRRNLTDIQRIIIAEKYRDIIEKQAKENLKMTGKNVGNKGCSNSNNLIDKQIDTKKELAKIAGVGVEKYYRTNKILKSEGNEDIKDKLKKGEISVNKAYTTLFPKKEKQELLKEEKIINSNNNTKKCTRCNLERNIDDFYINHSVCKECELKEQEIENKNKITNEDYNKLLERKYTIADIDKLNVNGDLNTIQEDCDDFIENLYDRLFDTEKVYERMNNEDKDKFKKIINNFINNINNVINKII